MPSLVDLLGGPDSTLGGLVGDFAQLPQAIQGAPPPTDPSVAQMLPPGAMQNAQQQYGPNFWNNFAQRSGNGQGFWASLGGAQASAGDAFTGGLNRAIMAANALRSNRLMQQSDAAFQQLMADPSIDPQTKQMLQLGGPQAAQQFLERKALAQEAAAARLAAQRPQSVSAPATEQYLLSRDASGNLVQTKNPNYNAGLAQGGDPNSPFSPVSAALQLYYDTGQLPRGQALQGAVLQAFPAFAQANGIVSSDQLSQHRIEYKAAATAIPKLEYQSSAIASSSAALDLHLKTMEAILNQTDPSGVPFANKVRLNSEGQLDADGGGAWIPALRSAARGAAMELAKIQSGNPLTGSPISDAKSADIEKDFNAYLSKGQFANLKNYAEVEAAQKRAAFQDTLNSMYSKVHNGPTQRGNPYASVPGLPGTGLQPGTAPAGYVPPGGAAAPPGAAPAAPAPPQQKIDGTYVPGQGLVMH